MESKIKYFVYPLVFLITTLFLSVGYAALSTIELDIIGSASSQTTADIVMTNSNIIASSNINVTEQTLSWYDKVANAEINLSSSNTSSYVTFEVTLRNNSKEDYLFEGITYDPTFYSNQDIIYSTNNLSVGSVFTSGSNLIFQITFKYSDSITTINTNNLSAYLNFNFKKAVMDINYYGITDINAPVSIAYNNNYTYNFNDNTLLDVVVTDTNGDSVNYTYNNGILTINNVVNNLNIYRIYSINYYGFKNLSNYLNEVAYGNNVSTTLLDTSASKVTLTIGEQELIEGTDYNFNPSTKELTINSPIGNISVTAHYPISYYGFTFNNNPVNYIQGGISGNTIDISNNLTTLPTSVNVYMGGIMQNNINYSNGIITLNFVVNDTILITNNIQFTESITINENNLSSGQNSTNVNTFGNGTYIVNNNANLCIGSVTLNINYSKSNGATRTINSNFNVVGRNTPISVTLNFKQKQNNATLTQTINFNYNDLTTNTYWPINPNTAFILDNSFTNLNGVTINNYEILTTTTECRDIE